MRVLALLLVSILLVSIVFAPEEEETTKREDVPPEQTEQFWKSSNNLKSATPDQVSAGLSQGVIGPEQLKQLSADQLRPNLGLLKEDQVKMLSKDQISSIGANNFASNQLKSLTKDQFSQSSFNDLDASKRTSVQPTVRNEIYSQASGVNVEVSQIAKTEDAIVYQDGFEIRSPIDVIKIDDTVLNNGVGIQYRSGVLSVDKADSTLFKEGHLILLEKLEKNGKTIKVQKADEIRAGCVRAKKVKNSVFEIKDKVNIKSEAGTAYSLRDCGGNELNYKSNADNLLSISKDTNAVVFAKNIVLGDGRSLSNISNSEASIDLTANTGFHCMQLTPPAAYEWDGSKIVPKTTTKLCLKQSKTQPLELNCNNCVNIDYENSIVYLNSEIDYLRKIDGIWTIVIENKGLTTLKLDRVMQIDEMLVSSGETITNPSNYFSIVEMPTKKGVHRMLRINPKIQKHSDSLIANYRTDYSPASIEVKNNHVVYKRGVLTVELLPPEPESRAIKRLLADLDSQESLIFTSFALILASLWFARKGQISLFIILGIFVLIFIALAYLFLNPPPINISSDVFDNVDGYVRNCLDVSSTKAVFTLGRYGDFVPADDSLKIHTLKSFDRNVVVEKLVDSIDANLKKCMNNLTSFPGISLIDGKKQYSFDWNENDVTVNVDYPFTAVQGNKSRTYSKFVTNVPVKLDSILNNVAAIFYSYQETGMIDLDALTGNLRIVIWPYNQHLLVSIYDNNHDIKNEKYMFNLALS